MVDSLAVITAAADSESESELATLVSQLGHQIVARCYELSALLTAIKNHPTAIALVDSHIYSQIPESFRRSVTIKAIDRTLTIDNLHSLLAINPADSNKTSNQISLPTHDKTVVFAAITSSAGVSTLALEYAEIQCALGQRTLFIDAHQNSPFLAERFHLHGIRSKSAVLSSGLTILECDIADSESIANTSEEISKAEVVVIDIGVIDLNRITSAGSRKQDRAVAAFISHLCHLVLIEDSLSYRASRINPIPDSLLLLKRISAQYWVRNKEPLTFSKQRAALGSYAVVRDFKSIEKSLSQKTTLFQAAPKSLILREIRRLAGEIAL